MVTFTVQTADLPLGREAVIFAVPLPVAVTMPSFTVAYFVIRAPAAIKSTAIGNFGMTFFAVNTITSAATPSARDGRLISPTVSAICSASSKNSPVPAVPPRSFGTCIRMMVVQMPVIKPPITGAEI